MEVQQEYSLPQRAWGKEIHFLRICSYFASKYYQECWSKARMKEEHMAEASK